MRKTYWGMGAAAALAVSGCAIVSGDHLEDLQNNGGDGGGTDTGTPDPDGGGPQLEFDDRCGSPTPRRTLTQTTRNIQINTAAYQNDNSSSCGATTGGNDAFIGVMVEAGEFWHFHLATPDTNRQPMLYLTPAGQCDSRGCEYVSTFCSGSGDEHFAFVANTRGLWYIGIDDSANGGGQYTLEAYRPVCANGTQEHGEGCDDGNMTDLDGCDRKCRHELNTERTNEREANDNRVEANALVFPPENSLEITGGIGGPGACTYHDVFALSVTANTDVVVEALDSSGNACANGALTPFNLHLQSAAGETVQTMRRTGAGCAEINRADLLAGEYFIRVEIPQETTTEAGYRLRISRRP